MDAPRPISDQSRPYVRHEGISHVQVITADGLQIADAAKLVGQHIANGVFWPTVIRVPLLGAAPSSRCRCYRLRSGAISDRTAVYEEDAFTPAQREIIAQAAVSLPPPLSCST